MTMPTELEITELVEFDVSKVAGVRSPANGTPILLMKQAAGEADPEPDEPDAPAFDHAAALAVVKAIVGRKVDESPDIAGGTAVLAQIADLIIAEAQELKAGNAGEICDIQQLACAAEMIWCWRTGEEAVASGSVKPATALMQSVRDSEVSPPGTDGDTAESEIAKEGTTVDTVTQTGDLSEVVKAADAKAAALEKRVAEQDSVIKVLEGRVAKVEATPVPTGIVLSRNVQVKQPGSAVNEDELAKAARYRELAETVTDRVMADGYRKLARDAEAKAVTPTS